MFFIQRISIGTNLNRDHPTIKFGFKYSKTSITFLDIKIHKNQNGILCTTICRRSDSAHLKSLKDSIPFSQALHIKRIYSEKLEVIRHFKDLEDVFTKRGYKLKLLNCHFERARRVDRKHVYKLRKSQLPRKIYHQWLLLIKRYQISKKFLINTGIFFLFMKFFKRFG